MWPAGGGVIRVCVCVCVCVCVWLITMCPSFGIKNGTSLPLPCSHTSRQTEVGSFYTLRRLQRVNRHAMPDDTEVWFTALFSRTDINHIPVY